VEDIAIAANGSWVAICPDDFVTSMCIDKRLCNCLTHFCDLQKEWVIEWEEKICEVVKKEEDKIANEAKNLRGWKTSL